MIDLAHVDGFQPLDGRPGFGSGSLFYDFQRGPKQWPHLLTLWTKQCTMILFQTNHFFGPPIPTPLSRHDLFPKLIEMDIVTSMLPVGITDICDILRASCLTCCIGKTTAVALQPCPLHRGRPIRGTRTWARCGDRVGRLQSVALGGLGADASALQARFEGSEDHGHSPWQHLIA